MLRHTLQGIGHTTCLELRQGINTIGRDPSNNHVISDPSVSTRHCTIEVSDATVTVRDRQSTNGTFVNDRPVTDSRLVAGDQLRLGSVAFTLMAEAFEIRVPVIEAAPPDTSGHFAPPGVENEFCCTRSPALEATHRCTKCQRPFHISNLRGVRLAGKANQLVFCPECDGPCSPINDADRRKAGRPTFLAQIAKALGLGGKR